MVSSPNLKIVPTHQGWTLNLAIANSIDQCQLAATHLSCHLGKNATRRRTALRSSRQAAIFPEQPPTATRFWTGPNGQWPWEPNRSKSWPWPPTANNTFRRHSDTLGITTHKRCVSETLTRAQRLKPVGLSQNVWHMYQQQRTDHLSLFQSPSGSKDPLVRI